MEGGFNFPNSVGKGSLFLYLRMILWILIRTDWLFSLKIDSLSRYGGLFKISSTELSYSFDIALRNNALYA